MKDTPNRGERHWTWNGADTSHEPQVWCGIICFCICPSSWAIFPIHTCTKQMFNSLGSWRPALLLTTHVIWEKSGDLSCLFSIIRKVIIKPIPICMIRATQHNVCREAPSPRTRKGCGSSQASPPACLKTGVRTHCSEARLRFQAGGNPHGLVHLPTQEHKSHRGSLRQLPKIPG